MAAEPADKPARTWLLASMLIAVVVLAYQPVWQAGFIWDDDQYVTTPELRSPAALAQIWTKLGATRQYYPLVHSVFWVEHRFWGDAPAPYHWVNILLHAMSAVLLAKVLRRLEVPGAWLAAGLFALHPVEVESVAWVSELKNTLSGVFYLSAALAYLRCVENFKFQISNSKSLYALSLLFFLLGLMSKTVVATLPAALLVVLWWKHGALSWKRDVLPLIPFFMAGIVAGLLTSWMERKFVHAEGAEFHFTLIERCLIAGRDVWFYLGKLCWPVDLMFVYPRWNVSQSVWWQWLFAAAALALLAVLVWRRWRGPLAGLLFFGGTLFPALGFFNVYPFRFSFVADHFQYLAGLGPLALAGAGLSAAAALFGKRKAIVSAMMCGALLLVLGTLTWRQCRMYADSKALWQTTLRRNPQCWLACNNLGAVYADNGQFDDAIDQYCKALRLKPDYAVALNNLGFALLEKGRVEESISDFRQAIAVKPNVPDAWYNLGRACLKQERYEAAATNFQTAIRLKPDDAKAYCNLGFALLQQGRVADAIADYQKSIALDPDYALPHNDLGSILLRQGDTNQARHHFERAAALAPDFAEARYNLGCLLLAGGRLDEALSEFEKVVELRPRLAEAHAMLGKVAAAYFRVGRADPAVAVATRALELARAAGETSLASELAAQLHNYHAASAPQAR